MVDRAFAGQRRHHRMGRCGFNSQKTIVIPALDMVVVFNAGRESKNMVAPELDLLDHYILPAASRD